MNDHISIDVTNAKVCAVPKDKFRINKYDFGAPVEDLVHNSEPFLHFQVLRPKDEEQRDKAMEYFNDHDKVYLAYANCLDMLLYLGCTKSIYIKSSTTDVEPEELRSIMAQAAHWYRFYGNEKMSEG